MDRAAASAVADASGTGGTTTAAAVGEGAEPSADATPMAQAPGGTLGKTVVTLVGVAGLAWGYPFGAQLSGPWLGVATAIGTGLFAVLLADWFVDLLGRAAHRRGAHG